MLQSEKNKMISDAKKVPLERHKYQDGKTFKFKVDYKDEAGTVYTSKPDRKIKFSNSFLTKQENTTSLVLY